MEEEKDLTYDPSAAALTLTSMKHEKLDEKTAAKLHQMKTEVRARLQSLNKAKGKALKPTIHVKSAASPTVLPEHGYSIDGTKLPRLPPIMREIIGQCSEPFEKQLTPTDVKDHQCRLALNKDLVKQKLLPMLNKKENVVEGVPVKVFGPDGKGYDMRLCFWSGKVYVLIKGWKDFFHEYGLEAFKHWATIWMFRHRKSDDLCMVITWKYVEHTNKLISSRSRFYEG
ncbi:hypothetical protein ACJIZ3_024440 [Penstemon smallii]|uniref:TF-B3 domain-containing protein n=1 Tax=Penstemon smallii TaxID=265156 RepID=A0ABD3TRT5_9LAMI